MGQVLRRSDKPRLTNGEPPFCRSAHAPLLAEKDLFGQWLAMFYHRSMVNYLPMAALVVDPVVR
jgi:hypothetical protein